MSQQTVPSLNSLLNKKDDPLFIIGSSVISFTDACGKSASDNLFEDKRFSKSKIRQRNIRSHGERDLNEKK